MSQQIAGEEVLGFQPASPAARLKYRVTVHFRGKAGAYPKKFDCVGYAGPVNDETRLLRFELPDGGRAIINSKEVTFLDMVPIR